jgi:uncharacterized coiled-coil DUF342 family protein
MAKPSAPTDPNAEIAQKLAAYRREVPAHRDRAFLTHQTAQEYRNYMNANYAEIDSTEQLIESHEADNKLMSSAVARMIGELKGKLLDLKGEIQGVRQSIKDSEDQYQQMTDAANAEFNSKKEDILTELREVEAQLAHYAEWMRMSDELKLISPS